MLRPTRTHRCNSWLALAVFALNAFWPLLSLANPGGSQAWMDVCSSTGGQSTPAGSTAPAQDSRSGIDIPQCPLCVVGGGMAVLAPIVASPLTLVNAKESRPPLSSLPAAPPAVFSPALPRAPPALS